jgi:hypothetical protein
MSKDDLVKSSLQRSFEDVVTGGADVNVSVVATGTLGVNCPNASSVFGKLKMKVVVVCPF